MDSLFKTLRDEFQDKIQTLMGAGVQREVHFRNVPNKINVAMGMRRTGKTYFVLQTILDLMKTTPLSKILYINFEDERLLPAKSQTLSTLLEAFYSLYPENHNHLCYLFLDEIQLVEDWPIVVRRFFDTKKVKIFLTGSSAKLLSKEIATSLRGRSIAIEIWPFNINEYLQAKNHDIIPEGILGKKDLDKFQEQLKIYIEEGGFPETTALEFEDRIQILQDYVSVVIMRDIIERHGITNVTLIRYLAKLLIKNAGSLFSVNKLYNDLKSQGFSVGKTTLYEYLEYMEDAYLVFSVPLYSESLRKVQTNPKKFYAIDTGLVRAYTLGMTQNIGHHFENLIYLDLRRKGHKIHYYLTESRREVDFLSLDRKGKWHLYQVAWDISDRDTQEREILALEEAEKELGVKGKLITPEYYLTSFLKED